MSVVAYSIGKDKRVNTALNRDALINPGPGTYASPGTRSNPMLKSSPNWKIGSASRDDELRVMRRTCAFPPPDQYDPRF